MTSLYAPLFSDHVEEKSTPAAPETQLAAHEPSLLPTLEYHAESDPDIHYIPKVTGCFALGALAMGISLNIIVLLLSRGAAPIETVVYNMILRMAFVVGITGVGASLLLVGLKVRDDHSSKILFPRHWLNALGTGALFSLIVWLTYLVVDRSINRFAMAAIWMCLMTFPGIAALWVVGPQRELGETASA